VADVGDGFESTYTVAYLLAQDSLDVRQAGRLRHGEVLIMGGDQCYPQATREEYKKRLLLPFSWAFTVPSPVRKLFAIPGNHDWYDGLNAFDDQFCRARAGRSQRLGRQFGNFQTCQHRSCSRSSCRTTGGSVPTSSSTMSSTRSFDYLRRRRLHRRQFILLTMSPAGMRSKRSKAKRASNLRELIRAPVARAQSSAAYYRRRAPLRALQREGPTWKYELDHRRGRSLRARHISFEAGDQVSRTPATSTSSSAAN
jgi:hypothetical protein